MILSSRSCWILVGEKGRFELIWEIRCCLHYINNVLPSLHDWHHCLKPTSYLILENSPFLNIFIPFVLINDLGAPFLVHQYTSLRAILPLLTLVKWYPEHTKLAIEALLKLFVLSVTSKVVSRHGKLRQRPRNYTWSDSGGCDSIEASRRYVNGITTAPNPACDSIRSISLAHSWSNLPNHAVWRPLLLPEMQLSAARENFPPAQWRVLWLARHRDMITVLYCDLQHLAGSLLFPYLTPSSVPHLFIV